MTGSVNVKQLLEEDPAFKRFAEEASLAVLMSDPNSSGVIGFFYTYYQMNMSIDAMIEIFVNMRRFQQGMS